MIIQYICTHVLHNHCLRGICVHGMYTHTFPHVYMHTHTYTHTDVTHRCAVAALRADSRAPLGECSQRVHGGEVATQ